MTTDKRVADVIAIIGRDKAHVDEIRDMWSRELDREQRNLKLLGPPMGLYQPLNKADKRWLKVLA